MTNSLETPLWRTPLSLANRILEIHWTDFSQLVPVSAYCKPKRGKGEKTTSRKGGKITMKQRWGRGQAGDWKYVDEELHNSSMRRKKTKTETQLRGVTWQHICLSRAKFSPISWADPSWWILHTYGYHNQMSADTIKHCCSHGNRGFWDMTRPQMDTGRASNVFKVQLNFSIVALNILFLQFLHATKSMDILLRCKRIFGFTLEQTVKKPTNQSGHVVQWNKKNPFRFIVIFFFFFNVNAGGIAVRMAGQKNKLKI